MMGIGMPMTPQLGQVIEASLDDATTQNAAWAGHGGYFNFAERPAERLRRAAAAEELRAAA